MSRQVRSEWPVSATIQVLGREMPPIVVQVCLSKHASQRTQNGGISQYASLLRHFVSIRYRQPLAAKHRLPAASHHREPAAHTRTFTLTSQRLSGQQATANEYSHLSGTPGRFSGRSSLNLPRCRDQAAWLSRCCVCPSRPPSAKTALFLFVPSRAICCWPTTRSGRGWTCRGYAGQIV